MHALAVEPRHRDARPCDALREHSHDQEIGTLCSITKQFSEASFSQRVHNVYWALNSP